MMHHKIIDTLMPLGIEMTWGEYAGDSEHYIIFSIYDEDTTDHCDNADLSEVYYITINYWFKNPEYLKNKSKIKASMEEAGFSFDGCKDRFDKDMKGISFDFIYEKEKENL
jgi:hypothetical protein